MTKPQAASAGQSRYTSRIQKGGALLDETRQLVRLWDSSPLEENKAQVIRANPLNKATRARILDVLNRIFIPRFVQGPIPNSWMLLRPLEDLETPTAITRPIYFWLTALAEPLLYDFCAEYLQKLRSDGLRGIDVQQAAAWVHSRGCDWSETVTIKVTRAMLAALRDFGVLQGRARKQLSSPSLPLATFAYISFCLHESGVAARNLLSHSDWKLFMLCPGDVEHMLLDCHQQHWLEYQAAGSVIGLSFPAGSAEEYARVVFGR